MKLVEIDGVEGWEIEKILNKRKIKGIVKYLMWWKEFTVEYNIWEREENLENSKKAVVEFEKKISVEVRR